MGDTVSPKAKALEEPNCEMNMDDNAKTRRILEWCFTEPQWKWLMKHEAFKCAADQVSTLQGIEDLSAKGATLLTKSRVTTGQLDPA